MMNTSEVKNHLRLICANGSKAQYDVLASDQLATFRMVKYPICLVVNTDPSYKSGQHWTSIFIKSAKDRIEFYDSYGRGMKYWSKDFENFVNRSRHCLLENAIQLQSVNSDVCGYYALYFLYKRMQGCRPETIYYAFSNQKYDDNDKKVKSFIISKKYLLKHTHCNFSNQQICTQFNKSH